jgi:hypothetical protein
LLGTIGRDNQHVCRIIAAANRMPSNQSRFAVFQTLERNRLKLNRLMLQGFGEA